MQILNVYKNWRPKLLLNKALYWDMVLSEDTTPVGVNGRIMPNGVLFTDCLSAYVDFTNPETVDEEGKVVSDYEYVWEGSVNYGYELKNIGLTGIDNGLIDYDVYDIDNQQFYDILTKSVLSGRPTDYRLHLKPISSNTKLVCTNTEYNEAEGYYAFKGGFLQGFYKLYGHEYQVLPQHIDDAWEVEVKLRPRDSYEGSCNYETLNERNPENKGIFFYMGTRAENKFAQFYYSDVMDYSSTTQDDFSCLNDDADKYYYCPDGKKYEDAVALNQLLIQKQLWSFLSPSSMKEDYICDGDNESQQPVHLADCEPYFADDYVENDDDLVIASAMTIYTDEGDDVSKDIYKIQTDNKYLFFNRTKNGFTVETYKDDMLIELTGETQQIATNLYLLLNRTPTGYTTENIDKFYEGVKEGKIENPSDASGVTKYTHYVGNDDKANAFALKYNDDGSISYRYLVNDCDQEKGIGILEETSFPGLISKDEWSVVNAKFQILDDQYQECPNGSRKMKIYIYVNGYLKFISKELPEFNFRELRENPEKQEAVPFNISIGGGTQGLSEGIWLDYRNRFPYVLPLEKIFAGTFMGDIQSFKFYTCPMNFSQIRNNYLWEMSRDNA